MRKTLGLTSLLFAALTFSAFAGKPTGENGKTGTAFTFNYNIGAVTNYHAYGFVCSAGFVSPQPANTVTLVNWWVTDLGPVSGSGTVACPNALVIRHQNSNVVGMLLFSDADNVAIAPNYITPVAMVILQTDGNVSIQVADPGGTGPEVFFGPFFSPFGWDLSPYLWN